MRRIFLGLFLMALTTLMLELTLVRVFDVIWYSNMAYMVITLAMFCFGLSGVYSSIRPVKNEGRIRLYLSLLAALLGVTALCILPALNLLPFNFKLLYQEPVKGMGYFLIMYFMLALPFFLAGLSFTIIFARYAQRIQALYFWDLVGAAIGCIILVPLLPKIGPGGLLFLACALGLWASALFSENRPWTLAALAAGVVVLVIPFLHDGYFDFRDHMDKRGVMSAKEKGRVEMSYWDPVSKIDVIDQPSFNRKHVAYDGGTQSSFIFPFDGDYAKLRSKMPDDTPRHFGGQNVCISHYFKRDTGQKVLVIGSAAGQETKAALLYGAAHVDAVELVGFVVKVGKELYADYNGNIFNDPRVNAVVGEGRSFLRSSNEKYDIIQIFSNHTSSSIAAGTGAMATTYLQTAEAYTEYFTHLQEDGLLHINHHIYPKMITTAALAWKKLGRTDFRKHVLVFQAGGQIADTLPTLLIKMTPWTPQEVDSLRNFFHGVEVIFEDPIHPEKGFLSDDFYSGSMPGELLAKMEYRGAASTDDRPYFNFLRKKIKKFSAEPGNYMDFSTAAILNKQLKRSYFPQDVIHLIVTGIASILFTVVFIFLPLFFSRAGRASWHGKASALMYFSCLGAGFIIFELVFIQIFMKLIGYPLYTYSTVVFALLLAAGLGSYASGRAGITPSSRWKVPFIGVLVTGIILLAVHQSVFELFLQTGELVRIAVAVALIFPLGFFLGMPFPLGILSIEKQPSGAIAWAWAMNGLFTVIGGMLSVLLSIFYGFRITLLAALLIYCLAFFLFPRMGRSAAGQ